MPSSSTPEPAEAESKAAFHLLMRNRGVRDLRVLRAFELVPRSLFVPPAHLPLAARDLPLPIGCGQTLLEPSLVARMIEALDVAAHHHVYEVGSGSGFATAILATLAGEVIGTERFPSLARGAQRRLGELESDNAAVIWGDGLVIPPQVAAFDRIILHGLIDDPGPLVARLAVGGVLVCARSAPAGKGQQVVRISRDEDGAARETVVCRCRLQAMISGTAAAL